MPKAKSKAVKPKIARPLFPEAGKEQPAPVVFSIRGLPVAPGDVLLSEQSYYGYVRVEKLAKGKVYYRTYLGASDVEGEDEEGSDKRAAPPLQDWNRWLSESSQQEFANHYSIRVSGTIPEFEAQALAHFLGGPDAAETDESLDTRLQVMSSRTQLESIERMVADKQNQADAMNKVMESKLRAFQRTADAMSHQMARIRQAIGFLETYLGTWQQVYIIAEGESAPATTPIALRQMILFMDEETGDPTLGAKGQTGIDFQSVEQFDDWLTARPENLARVLPESKGVVAIRPTRADREYSDDWREQAEMMANNKMAYLLIRNGGNVYRIWLGDTLGRRLFPMLDEFKSDTYRGREIEKIQMGYQGNMALIQGLLDRTDVLKPLPHYINLNQSETWNGLIQLVRDGESASQLSDGRLRWPEWKKQINAAITRGTRVYFGPGEGSRYGQGEYFNTNFTSYYSKHNCPPGPKAGVYTVEGRMFPDKVEDDRRTNESHRKANAEGLAKGYDWNHRIYEPPGYRLYILYNPGDIIYDNSWRNYYDRVPEHERKVRVGWWVDPTREQVLNYDLLTLEDIDYYLGNRLDREHFLSMVVPLWGLRKVLQAERDWEAEFARALAGRLGVAEDSVQEAITWWKHKVIWKRAITSDDAKAWRMIEARLRRTPNLES